MSDEVLFHYCSNRSFLSIIQSREIFASELTLSNDALEGRWAKTVFSQICKDDPTLVEHHDELLDRFNFLSEMTSGAMGFCLSEDGDLLSQWRGYADNGSGVSIGFSRQYFEDLYKKNKEGPVRKVIYDEEEQRAWFVKMVEELKKLIQLGAFKSILGGLLFTPSDEEKNRILQASTDLWSSYLYAIPTI